ncbi:SCO family protein [Erythrobacter sp. W53]|uniref:SCO family protein n=1 Tax=Erythrobacter sp. W53 TaxID=3425947 RepID=UPI003D76739A
MARLFAICASGVAASLLAACSPAAEAPVGEPPLAGATIGGPFELTGANGKTVRWEDFRGKYTIVYFGFAYCPDICPTDMQRMAQGLSEFTEANPTLGANVQPIFVTIDPERDTPEVVAEFTSAFSDRIIGLTGSADQVKAAADAFRVFYQRGETQPGGGYLMDHTNITYLFGPAGEPIATLPTDEGYEAVAEELAKWVR